MTYLSLVAHAIDVGALSPVVFPPSQYTVLVMAVVCFLGYVLHTHTHTHTHVERWRLAVAVGWC